MKYKRVDYAIVAEKRPTDNLSRERLDEYAAYIVKADGNMFHAASFFQKFQFDEFIEKFGIKLTESVENSYQSERYGKVTFYWLDKIFKDSFYFTSLDQIPENAKPLKLLSNGSIVDGFYTDENNVITFWRPNPNCKDIYKPMELEEHIAYQQAHGVF